MLTKINKVKKEEGFRGQPYKCTEGKLTIGYGFNLEAEELPEQVADLWLHLLLAKIEDQLTLLPWYLSLDYPRQTVIVDMCYQLGVAGTFKFKNMIRAINDRDYDRAAYELLDSKYARQTPERAKRNAEIMRKGEA